MSLSLEIDLLRSFTVIAEVRALSRAANRIGRTQSALSQQMKRLEEIVDQPLFQRTGRGVVLTNPGERLLIHAQRILRLHDEAMADLSGKGLSGTIRFGCPDDYAAVFLPHLLRQFSSQHPHALVEVMCAPTPRLLEQLEMHALDLAMISLPDDAANDDIIRREPLVWVGYPGLDSAHFDPLPLAVSDPDTLDHVAACEALQLPPHEVAYVGDHPEIDWRGAADAGLLSVWIDRHGGHTPGEVLVGRHRIASLAELPALLGADTRFGAPSTFR